jgi:hypothetical protein
MLGACAPGNRSGVSPSRLSKERPTIGTVESFWPAKPPGKLVSVCVCVCVCACVRACVRAREIERERGVCLLELARGTGRGRGHVIGDVSRWQSLTWLGLRQVITAVTVSTSSGRRPRGASATCPLATRARCPMSTQSCDGRHACLSQREVSRRWVGM